MKISLKWLKDYVPISFSAEKLAHRLTMAGLEVEKIDERNGDTVLELEITPNRPDCLNYLGIAREVSAVLNKNLKLPRGKSIKLPATKCPVEILDREACLRYIGTVVQNVKIVESPDWIKDRLTAIGVRLINNIVDVTNFSLFENGQPLHAFDYDKLDGGKIVVRRARAGEKIVTIDGIERTLDASILVIADTKKPVAIAGIMGGKGTEVTNQTKNILLESAYFNPIVIRRAARKLGLVSDSSYRFERGVNIENVQSGSARALQLILQLAGGTVVEHQDLFPNKRKSVKAAAISVRREYLNDFLGSNITASEAKTILKKLGFDVRLVNRENLQAVPPSTRNDIRLPEDLIEEIARVIGYDNLPMTLPQVAISNVPLSKRRQRKEDIRSLLVALGLNEIVAYSMINRSSLEKCNLTNLQGVRVINPLSQEQELLRPSTLPSVLAVARLNIHRGQKDLRLFEIGKIYEASGERDVISVLLSGRRTKDWRANDKKSVDLYDIKGIVEKVFEQSAVKVEGAPLSDPIFQRGQAGELLAKGKSVAVFGKINSEILQKWDIKQGDLFFAQIDLELLCTQTALRSFKPLNEYPAIVRDVSLAVRKDVSFGQLQEIASDLGEGILTEVSFLEQYVGEKISADQRGLVFSLVYQSTTKTLTEEEVNKVHQRITQAFVDKLQAKIR